MENPKRPSDQKRNSTEWGDRSQPGNVRKSEGIQTAGEENDSCEKPPESSQPMPPEGDGKERDSMNEMIQCRCFPVVNPSRFLQLILETVSTKCAKGDSEEDSRRSGPSGGRLVHIRKITAIV